uniref:Uncharacterized protein n=1 Tax=Romanomermis culicivorax TaxID=13658 RepID=A0A915IDQ5_ROMCU
MIHEIVSAISNEYNALASNKYNASAVKHQSAIKCKTNNNDTTISPTKIAGEDDSTTKIAKEEFVDATKMVEEEVTVAKKIIKEKEGIDATKFAGEQSNASEDQK